MELPSGVCSVWIGHTYKKSTEPQASGWEAVPWRDPGPPQGSTVARGFGNSQSDWDPVVSPTWQSIQVCRAGPGELSHSMSTEGLCLLRSFPKNPEKGEVRATPCGLLGMLHADLEGSGDRGRSCRRRCWTIPVIHKEHNVNGPSWIQAHGGPTGSPSLPSKCKSCWKMLPSKLRGF